MSTLITGGGSGLGLALAKRISKGVTTIGHGCNIEVDFENMKNLQEALPAIPKDIEVCIHCVGTNRLSPNVDLSWTELSRAMRVNAISNFVINNFLIEQRKVHQIIHIVSDAAHKPMTHSLSYNMSKAAQLMLVRQMAREHKPDPIIFAVSPGKIKDTPMSKYIDETFPVLRGMTKEEGRKYLLSGLQTVEIELRDAVEFIIALILTCNRSYHGHNFIFGG